MAKQLKIYEQNRSEFLVELAYKLPQQPAPRFRHEGKKHGLTYQEWTALSGYFNSNEFKKKKLEGNTEALESIPQRRTPNLKKMSLAEYRQTSYWHSIRSKALHRDRTCRICNSNNNVYVHHRSHRHIGEKGELEDLITLCQKCFFLTHRSKSSNNKDSSDLQF